MQLSWEYGQGFNPYSTSIYMDNSYINSMCAENIWFVDVNEYRED